MKKLLYDNTYYGFLNAIGKAADEKIDEISAGEEEDLFSETFNIKTEPEKARALENKINKLHPEALKKLRLLYLSESPGFENTALGYLKNILSHGAAGETNLADKEVSRTDKICKKVLCEVHRFKGFIRFSELKNGLMFSKISPEHNILPLLKSHFRTRFGKMNFIIYDEKRNKALINSPAGCAETEISDPKFKISENEKQTRELWKNFFKTIEIKERKNPELQKNKVPLKYRKNLLEFEEDKTKQ